MALPAHRALARYLLHEKGSSILRGGPEKWSGALGIAGLPRRIRLCLKLRVSTGLRLRPRSPGGGIGTFFGRPLFVFGEAVCGDARTSRCFQSHHALRRSLRSPHSSAGLSV